MKQLDDLLTQFTLIQESSKYDGRKINFDSLTKKLLNLTLAPEMSNPALKEKILLALNTELGGSIDKLRLSFDELITITSHLDWIPENERDQLIGSLFIDRDFISNYYQNLQSEISEIELQFSTTFLDSLQMFDGTKKLLKAHKKIEVFEHFRELFSLMHLPDNKDLLKMVYSILENKNYSEKEKFFEIIKLMNSISVPEKFLIKNNKIFYTDHGKGQVDIRYFYPTSNNQVHTSTTSVTLNPRAYGEGLQGITHPYKSWQISKLIKPNSNTFKELIKTLNTIKKDKTLLSQILSIDNQENILDDFEKETFLDIRGRFSFTVLTNLLQLSSNVDEHLSFSYIMRRNSLTHAGASEEDSLALDASIYLLALFTEAIEHNPNNKDKILSILKHLRINYFSGNFKNNNIKKGVKSILLDTHKISILMQQLDQNILLADPIPFNNTSSKNIMDLINSSKAKQSQLNDAINSLIILFPDYEALILKNIDVQSKKSVFSGTLTNYIGRIRQTERAEKAELLRATETERAEKAELLRATETERAEKAELLRATETERAEKAELLRATETERAEKEKTNNETLNKKLNAQIFNQITTQPGDFWQEAKDGNVQFLTIFNLLEEHSPLIKIHISSDEFLRLCIAKLFFNNQQNDFIQLILESWKKEPEFVKKILAFSSNALKEMPEKIKEISSLLNSDDTIDTKKQKLKTIISHQH